MNFIKYINILLLILTSLSSSIQVGVFYNNRQCKWQGLNLGTSFNNPLKCAEVAITRTECGDYFMWSELFNNYWGCRCCTSSSESAFGSTDIYWKVYRITDIPTAAPTLAPTLAPTAFRTQYCSSDLNTKFCGYTGISSSSCEALNCCDEDYQSQSYRRRRRRRLEFWCKKILF